MTDQYLCAFWLLVYPLPKCVKIRHPPFEGFLGRVDSGMIIGISLEIDILNQGKKVTDWGDNLQQGD